MKQDSGKTAVPDLLLERYRLNEVSLAERAAIERGLAADAAVRQRLAAIERSDEEIQASGFTASLAARLRGRAAGLEAGGRQTADGPGTLRLPRWAVPAVIGAAAILLVVVGVHTRGPRPDSSGERIKGLRPSLAVFRQTPDGSETLADASSARAGDVVRLAYQAAGQSYGAIVSIDGRGAVTLQLPEKGHDAAPLRSGDRVLLDHAYELDDAPGWECFYFVTATEPFGVQPIVEAAEREAALRPASPPVALRLPRGLEQSRFVLQKEHRP